MKKSYEKSTQNFRYWRVAQMAPRVAARKGAPLPCASTDVRGRCDGLFVIGRQGFDGGGAGLLHGRRHLGTQARPRTLLLYVLRVLSLGGCAAIAFRLLSLIA